MSTADLVDPFWNLELPTLSKSNRVTCPVNPVATTVGEQPFKTCKDFSGYPFFSLPTITMVATGIRSWFLLSCSLIVPQVRLVSVLTCWKRQTIICGREEHRFSEVTTLNEDAVLRQPSSIGPNKYYVHWWLKDCRC